MAVETAPLLGEDVLSTQQGAPSPKKPFYRPRQLWIMPFFLTASMTRGMTLATRIDVFTSLACRQVQWSNDRTPSGNNTNPLSWTTDTLSDFHSVSISPSEPTTPFIIPPTSPPPNDSSISLPSLSMSCSDDPAVQADAAKIQAILTTTMGLLSAITSGWWGQFSERHGRLRVMAAATLGLLLTDLSFLIISHPSLPFLSDNLRAHHAARALLVISPSIEGLLGGWTALQSSSTAYISDCTSSGSRSHVFSRLIGIMFLGVSVGPALGGWLFQHPFPMFEDGGNASMVAFMAVIFSFCNLFCLLFVFPESLSKERRQAAKTAYHKPPESSQTSTPSSRVSSKLAWVFRPIKPFLTPLAVFLPTWIPSGNGSQRKRDWSLTFLALSAIFFLLTMGIYQLKYMYAGHVYKWGTERMSYFITLIAGARAVYTIFIFPVIVSAFKPKPPEPSLENEPSQTEAMTAMATSDEIVGSLPPAPPQQASTPSAIHPQTPTPATLPTPAQLKHLAKEIHFDLLLAKCGLVIDVLSNVLICATPLPRHTSIDALQLRPSGSLDLSAHSEGLFLFSAVIASLGSGTLPVFQSLALCLLKARKIVSGVSSGEGEVAGSERQTQGSDVEGKGEAGSGQLFGALAVLQALGQMIIGPALFGIIYSSTVATYPQAMFLVCGAILTVALLLALLIRPPLPHDIEQDQLTRGQRSVRNGENRGRSRAVRELTGIAYESASGPLHHQHYGTIAGSSTEGGIPHGNASA